MIQIPAKSGMIEVFFFIFLAVLPIPEISVNLTL